MDLSRESYYKGKEFRELPEKTGKTREGDEGVGQGMGRRKLLSVCPNLDNFRSSFSSCIMRALELVLLQFQLGLEDPMDLFLSR